MTDDAGDALTRRAALTAIAAGSLGLAGCSSGAEPDESPGSSTDGSPPSVTGGSAPTAPPETDDGRFETVIDVDNAGGATDASESITSLVESKAGDDTALIFPDGRYLVEPIVLSGLDNFAMRAAPDAEPVLVPAGPASEFGKFFLQLTSVERLLLEGLTFDFTAEGHGGMTFILGTGDFTVADVTVDGPMPPDTSAFRYDVVERGSHGLVENLVVTDGSEPESTSVGIYVGSDHAGTLTFRDCEVANFPNNGLYASSPGREDALAGANGPVQVEGGVYRNNNIANVRLGSTDSYVRDAEVVIDEVPPALDGDVNARGIRFRARGGHLVENCDVRIEPAEVNSLGGIVVHRASRDVRVEDSTIAVESEGVPAINLLPPDDGTDGSTFENVEVTGAAAGGEAVRVVDRDGTTFRNCSIDQRGNERNGIRFEDSLECGVHDSDIAVTRKPIVNIGSDVSTTNSQLRALGTDENGATDEDTETDSPPE